MPPPRKAGKPTSAAGRQAGDYSPPVLAEPKGGPIPTRRPEVRSKLAPAIARHLPGKHNQLSHGDGGTGAIAGAIEGNRQRFKPGRGAFGSNDVEANAMIVDGPGGREVRFGVVPSLAADDGDVWDGDPDRTDTVVLSRRGLRRLRNDLDEGRTQAKAALAADPDNSGRLAEGLTGGVRWAMYGEDVAPFSIELTIDTDGDGVVLDPKQLDRFLSWLDDLDGQLGAQSG